MRSRHTDIEPLVNLSDITEIELVILKRMREVTIGDHRSRQHGSGFDFLGLRDWQAGDRFSSIDWGQSSLTNFSPLVIREFEQPSNATVVAIVDRSLSTRCGVDGVPIAAAVARAIATIGLSAVFFQDPFGLITFDQGFEHLGGVRPRTGKSHVVHCLDAYQHDHVLQPVRRSGDLSATIGGYLREPVDAAGDLRLPVRSSRGAAARAGAAQRHARRVRGADRQLVRVPAAAGLVGLDRDHRRRDRPHAHGLAGGAGRGSPNARGSTRTACSTRPRSSTWTSSASASTRRRPTSP